MNKNNIWWKLAPASVVLSLASLVALDLYRESTWQPPFYLIVLFWFAASIPHLYLIAFSLWHWKHRYRGRYPLAWAIGFPLFFSFSCLFYYVLHVARDKYERGAYAEIDKRPAQTLPGRYNVLRSVCFVLGAALSGWALSAGITLVVTWHFLLQKLDCAVGHAAGKVWTSENVQAFHTARSLVEMQKAMAELFGVNTPAISRHLKNVYDSGELVPTATISKMETVQTEGGRQVVREIEFYNLDAVIAVGYRVNSLKATHFRIWATNTLREFIVKGFVLNDTLLKNGRAFGKDYFDELLERIREIRASERRVYQKLADVFEQCSSDYQSNSEETKRFYQIVQNQLHFAVTGQTAAEVSKLNRLAGMFIDYAELRALNRQVTTMKERLKQVERFLAFNEQQVLRHAGLISHEMAVLQAHGEFEKFRVKQDQDYISEFDQVFARHLKGKPE